MAENGIKSRKNQAEVRREQIIDAALTIFAEKGCGGTSVREIARCVGVTEGLIYHYFASKEELMRACFIERSWGAQLEMILIEAKSRPLLDAVRLIVKSFMETLDQNADSVRMSVMETQRCSDINNLKGERIASEQALIYEFLRTRQDRGEINPEVDVNQAATLLLGTAFSLFLLWHRDNTELWKQKTADYLQNGVGLLFLGLQPR